MPSKEKIHVRMQELAKRLNYDYRDISHLSAAMYCKKEAGYNDYTNDAMATLGDAVLKLVFAEYFFDRGLDKDAISERKAHMEKNATLKAISDRTGLYLYAYNDRYFANEAPSGSRLPYGNHDIYLEAIIAAIYRDRGLAYTRRWILDFWPQNGFALSR
ncbi:MAG: hypothetical protein E7585_01940 [Ruminococcaceae bacterium]|nr:hypothetical protein [Oscillospiraceae bacterium]